MSGNRLLLNLPAHASDLNIEWSGTRTFSRQPIFSLLTFRNQESSR